MTDHEVQFTRASPETVLPANAPELARRLGEALSAPVAERVRAMSAVAADYPRCLDAWAALAEMTDDPVERYAFARVGYHRGLDALRAAGWRGSGHVTWAHEENRGFLRSLEALRQAAASIGEVEEEERCSLFLRQLDPQWRIGALPTE
jgi:Protein of unknown function (DUF3151)